jgi:hypothetical protein
VDLNALEEESKNASAGKQLLTRMTDFTKTITDKLDSMTFHNKQELEDVKELVETVISDSW